MYLPGVTEVFGVCRFLARCFVKFSGNARVFWYSFPDISWHLHFFRLLPVGADFLRFSSSRSSLPVAGPRCVERQSAIYTPSPMAVYVILSQDCIIVFQYTIIQSARGKVNAQRKKLIIIFLRILHRGTPPEFIAKHTVLC